MPWCKYGNPVVHTSPSFGSRNGKQANPTVGFDMESPILTTLHPSAAFMISTAVHVEGPTRPPSFDRLLVESDQRIFLIPLVPRPKQRTITDYQQ